MSKLKKLLEYQEKICEYQNLTEILLWDMRIVAPEKAKEKESELKNKYALKVFKLKTAEKYGKLLKEVIQSSEFEDLSEEEQRYLKNYLKEYEESKKVPAKVYKEFLKTSDKSALVWQEAKAKNDYQMFKPYLEKMIKATKEYYRCFDPNKDLYDVMLDQYERGMTSKIIDPLFAELKKELIPLIKRIKTEKKDPIKIDYNKEELKTCGYYLLDYIGFDNKRGIIDAFPHGYTDKLSYNDIRIAFSMTTDPADFVSTIIHEGGHGLLEQNVSPFLAKYTNDFIAYLYALHESQSRFYENILGRNKNFWLPIWDDIKRLLRLDISLDDFVSRLNCVTPSLIRTQADEVTYCLHIILRYELEKEIFRNNLSVDELPKLWNAKMREYFDLEVPSDSEGLMQDIHWAEGNFGYFPSYLLGNIYDGMLIEAIEEKLGSIDTLLKEGKIKEITQFLKENIHQYGSAYNSLEMLERVCGKPINAHAIINYFKNKYEKNNLE